MLGATSVMDLGVINEGPSTKNKPNENLEAEKPQVDFEKLWKKNLVNVYKQSAWR